MTPLRERSRSRLRRARTETVHREERLAVLKRSHQLLQALYDTSTALSRFESIEQTVPQIMARVTACLACRSIVIILSARGPDQPLVWQTESSPSAASLEHARAWHDYFAKAKPRAGRARAVDVLSESSDAGEFISLPLVASRGLVLGTLQLEFARRPDEGALGFASTLAGQLAGAIARQATEEAISISEKRFSGIVSLASDAIVAFDEQQRITLLNTGAEHIFGYSREEALGAPLSLLLPERLHTMHVASFAKDQESSSRMGARTEVLGRRKNGQEFPAEAAIYELQVAGKWESTVVLRDLSEAKRIEAEQRFLAEASVVLAAELEYQETLRSIARLAVAFLADVCMIDGLDDDGQSLRLEIATANPALAPLAEELRKHPLRGQSDPFVHGVFETRRSELRSDLAPDFVETAAQSPEHRRVLEQLGPRSFMAVPILSRQRLLGAIVFISTSKGRRYGAKELLLAEELARRAGYAVDNAQLYRQARQATRDREDLLAVVSHDLKNPLSTILMALKMLETIGVTDHAGASSHLDRIERSALRMHHMVDDLLNVASLQSGRLSVVPGPMRLEGIVAEAIEVQRLSAERKYLHVTYVESPSELPAVWADAERLQQVLANLLGNAIKFTPAGGAVTVRTELSGEQVTVSVADTGPGIEPENLPHVFERFWQASRSAGLGTGLGLFISKGIVEALGGEIWAESQVGLGTTFSFALRTAGESAGAPSAANSNQSAAN